MHSGQDRRVRLNATQEGVAGTAEHLPNRTALMAMIDNERPFGSAYGATPRLILRHPLHFGDSEAVVFPQSLALVDGSRRLGVLRSLASQA